MYCMKCGAQLPDDASFCYKCGSSTSPTATEGNLQKAPESVNVPTTPVSNAHSNQSATAIPAAASNTCYIEAKNLQLSPDAKKIKPFKIVAGAYIKFDGQKIQINAIFNHIDIALSDVFDVSMHHAGLTCDGISIELNNGKGYYLYTGFGDIGYKKQLGNLREMVEAIKYRL